MEGTKRRAANSLGMFDLLKGVGMLTIVFAHTGELYPMGDASHINPLTFCMFAYRESLMAAFYIASGYGFRKRSIGKCIDQQFKTLLKPYIYTGIATTVFQFIIHYPKETVSKILPFNTLPDSNIGKRNIQFSIVIF